MNGSVTEPNDTERLRFLMLLLRQDLTRGYVSVEYPLVALAEENGREEPTPDDELECFRRLIDCAMSGGDKS